MCTYNGELFLPEQLESIALQTVLPNELVICDDGSTDSTLSIIYKFKKEVPFSVRIYKNTYKVPLGATKNFEKAVSLCRGEIIALSDQDDVWLPKKLEKLVQSFKENPSIGYVFSDALVVDEKLHPLGYTLLGNSSFTFCKRRIFEKENQLKILLKHCVASGSAMAFRAKMKGFILPISDQWSHDAWIALLLSAAGVRGLFINEPLIKYRQHRHQLKGCTRRMNFNEIFRKINDVRSEYYINQSNIYKGILDKLTSMDRLEKNSKKLLENKINHLQKRQYIYGKSTFIRFYVVFVELCSGRYNQFSKGWKSAIKDLYVGRIKN